MKYQITITPSNHGVVWVWRVVRIEDNMLTVVGSSAEVSERNAKLCAESRAREDAEEQAAKKTAYSYYYSPTI